MRNLHKLREIKKFNKLYGFKAYPWQKEFFNAGKDHPERMLSAANRVGKTYSAAHEVAFHATGLYPDDWDGKIFDNAILIWAGGVTNEALRDIVQKELLGGMGEDLGTGAIPKNLIGTVTKRQCGIGDVADTARIKHTSGDWSTITFKSYEQGWKKWQGTAPHVVWMDEEPDFKIYTEARTRIVTSDGIILVTFTPLSGLTELVQHYREGKEGTFVKNVTWDDAPHMNEETKRIAMASFPEHERDARTKGIPMMGEGRIFPFSEEDYSCTPIEIPMWWPEIIGIDFGYNHPAATSKISYDADNDIIYVSKSTKKAKMDAAHHSEVIRGCGGSTIPVSWPHDGINAEKGKGEQLISNYKGKNLNLLGKSARYKNDVGGGQSVEKSIMDVYERIQSGRFKVFKTEHLLLEEMRNYHRKDGKVVDRMDDCISSVRYAAMMLRYAAPKYIDRQSNAPTEAYL